MELSLGGSVSFQNYASSPSKLPIYYNPLYTANSSLKHSFLYYYKSEIKVVVAQPDHANHPSRRLGRVRQTTDLPSSGLGQWRRQPGL
jgi:hypothetical protein